jgi:hypothetical protein
LLLQIIFSKFEGKIFFSNGNLNGRCGENEVLNL